MRLGEITDTTGLKMDNFKKALKLGIGAGAFPILYGWLRGMAVQRGYLAQGTPVEYGVRAVAGIVLGTLTRRYGAPEMGDGMMASAVGSIVSDVVTPFLNPTAGAAKIATQAQELQGIPSFSASNPMGAGLAGLGYGPSNGDQSLLFGVGTPDMSASRMFSGATVAIEQPGLSGATVAIEQPSAFAGSLY